MNPFDEGRACAKAGGSADDNPYKDGTSQSEDWHEGYRYQRIIVDGDDR